jgi:hypothetical protein
MPKFKDRTGNIHGRLTVLCEKGRDHRGKRLWLCQCACGNNKIVAGDNLSSNKSNSCGCLKKEFLARKGNQWGLYENRQEAMLKVQYSHLKRRHKKFRGVLLSFEDYCELVKKPCEYCGLEYSRTITDRLNESLENKRLSDEILKINGLDRKYSGLGYTNNNVVVCCKGCNFAKHTMSQQQFFDWVKRVYDHLFK